jgi:hypothetical protein
VNYCYRVIYAILLILAAVSGAAAQDKTVSIIKGAVTDAESKEPLIAASIYFTETTIGTIAGKKGSYTLVVPRPGNYELVVSMVGYEMKKMKMFVQPGREETLNFQLQPKAVNVKTVEVKGVNQSEWKSNLAIFTRKFFGRIGGYRDCEIENKEIINFRWAKDTLIAAADKPVVVINNYLGYRIAFEIRTYRYNTATTAQEFSYKSFFVELKPENDSQKEDWGKNRENTFFGSPVHFLWALKYDRLADEGFKVNFSSDPFMGEAKEYEEIRNSKDIQKGEQFLGEPQYSFSGFVKVSYHKDQVSYILLREPYFTIDSNGIANNHLPFLSVGYWADSGAANMLPSDYLPESIKKIMPVK